MPLAAKVVLLGNSGVGKTCLYYAAQNRDFKEYPPTNAPTQCSLTIRNRRGDDIPINLWDTGGQDHLQSLGPLYVRDANAVLFTYDVTEDRSFRSLKDWRDFIFDHISPIPALIVGTHCDLTPVVPKDDVERWGIEIDAQVFETSARSGVGINELLTAVATLCTPAVMAAETTKLKEPSVVIVDGKATPEDSGCCMKSVF
jgi:small GTP-binding protein